MTLAHCILGNSLSLVCYCFPRHLTFPLSPPVACTSATTREILAAIGGTVGEKLSGNFCLNYDFHVNLGNFCMPQIYDMEPKALLPLRRKACWGFFHPKNPMASAWFQQANLCTKSSTLLLDHRRRYATVLLMNIAVFWRYIQYTYHTGCGIPRPLCVLDTAPSQF